MPRISRAEKAENRRRIVESASPRFRSRGVDNVGIDEVMGEAGLTHGAFYNHFDSKESLAAAVYTAAFAPAHARLADAVAAGPSSDRSALAEIVTYYLSAQHRDAPDGGCPSASLATDAVRHGTAVQHAYCHGISGYIDGFTAGLMRDAAARGDIGSAQATRQQAIAILTELVGAITMSRAVAEVDAALSDEILDSARARLGTILSLGPRNATSAEGTA